MNEPATRVHQRWSRNRPRFEKSGLQNEMLVLRVFNRHASIVIHQSLIVN